MSFSDLFLYVLQVTVPVVQSLRERKRDKLLQSFGIIHKKVLAPGLLTSQHPQP